MKRIAFLLLLAGCAAKGPSPEDAMKAGLLDATVAQVKAPLFKLTCPPTGCIISSLEVGNPNGASQMIDIARIALTPQPSEASQNFRAVLGTVAQVGNTGVIGHFASSIFGKIVGGFTSGFDANSRIAQAGFDSNAKAYDALKEALLKPAPTTPTPPATPPTYALTGTFQNVLLGGGTQSNWSNSYNMSMVCALFPTSLGCK